MCGIVGMIDLQGGRTVCVQALEQMALALVHRGPDDEGYFTAPGVGLASRRLSIVGIADGRQPVFNEDRSVVAVYNGELFDHVELRSELVARGHHIRSRSDTELLVHLWEDRGEEMFSRLRGQFAFALVDLRQQRVILGRDRFGICPLYWTRTAEGWLVFGSEIKALLASGLVPRAPDLCGIDNIFTFFWMPGRRTAFRGISAVPPGNFLRIEPVGDERPGQVREVQYWDIDFPDRGDELDGDEKALKQQFRELLDKAIRIRLRADVPVAAYLSGGVDSSIVVARSSRMLPSALPTFTARLQSGSLDESRVAGQFARDLKCRHHTVTCDAQTLARVYPQAALAYDCPSIDPNSGSILELSRAVRSAGCKVVLTGEGADEALAGYIWYRAHKLMRLAAWGPLRPLEWGMESLFQRKFPRAPRGEFARINRVQGGLHAWTPLYHLTSAAHWWLLNDDVLSQVQREAAFDQFPFDAGRMRRWHPLNQSLYVGYKIHLPGLLHRADHMSLANAVEARYPFLDEDLVAFCARLHPRWKLRGLRGEKHLLRITAADVLPRSIAFRKKAPFRAPTVETLLGNRENYFWQLFSPESLRRSPYFDAGQVLKLCDRTRRATAADPFRLFYGVALWAVAGTQLWHHLYLGGGLCELPEWTAPVRESRRSA
jgi:asparagine synthase (glutamine-hydrolysing)